MLNERKQLAIFRNGMFTKGISIYLSKNKRNETSLYIKFVLVLNK